MASRFTFVLVSVLLVAACLDDSPTYELDGLVVRTKDFEEICAESLPYFERRLESLERATGLPRDPKGVFFHWYLNGPPRKWCPPASNCTIKRSFYSEFYSFSHELAHAQLYRLGRPRRWLVEGMAVMLDDDHAAPANGVQSPSDMMRMDDPFKLDYSEAGAFVTYLRDRYGMARLLAYYQASAGAGVDRSIALFADTFGDSFADVEAEYLALAIFPTAGSPPCDAPEVAWTGATWRHDFVLACDEPGSLGPRQSWNDGDDSKGAGLFSEVTMTLPPGRSAFEIAFSEPVWITISGCDLPERVNLTPDAPRTTANFQGGKYLVSAQSYLDPMATATITVRPLPQVAAPAPTDHQGPTHLPIGRDREAYPCKARMTGP